MSHVTPDRKLGAENLLVRQFGGFQGRILLTHEHEGRHRQGRQLLSGKRFGKQGADGVRISQRVEVEEHLAQAMTDLWGRLRLGAEIGIQR